MSFSMLHLSSCMLWTWFVQPWKRLEIWLSCEFWISLLISPLKVHQYYWMFESYGKVTEILNNTFFCSPKPLVPKMFVKEGQKLWTISESNGRKILPRINFLWINTRNQFQRLLLPQPLKEMKLSGTIIIAFCFLTRNPTRLSQKLADKVFTAHMLRVQRTKMIGISHKRFAAIRRNVWKLLSSGVVVSKAILLPVSQSI